MGFSLGYSRSHPILKHAQQNNKLLMQTVHSLGKADVSTGSLSKFERVLCKRTDRQTDRHTDRQTYRRTEMMLIAILRTSAKRSKQLTSIQSNSAKTRITAAYTQTTEPRLQHGRTYAMQTRTGTFESISSRLKTLE